MTVIRGGATSSLNVDKPVTASGIVSSLIDSKHIANSDEREGAKLSFNEATVLATRSIATQSHLVPQTQNLLLKCNLTVFRTSPPMGHSWNAPNSITQPYFKRRFSWGVL